MKNNNGFEYHCPECFYIPLIEISPDFKYISIQCKNNHYFQYNINEFIKENPLNKEKIKCNHCASKEKNNVYDLLYCIQCKKYVCKKDYINYHFNCKKIIYIEELFSTCLEHKSPLITLCESCDKEICEYCEINNHKNHFLLDDIQNIISKTKFLINNKPLEKIFIDKLLSEYNCFQKRPLYNNLFKLYEFLNNITLKELLNQRYSTILYLNLFMINSTLYKFKMSLKPYINKEKNEKKYIEKNHFLKNFIESFILYLQNDIDKVNVLLFNKQNNFFISLIENRIKILKNKEERNIFIKQIELDEKNKIQINLNDYSKKDNQPLNKFFNQEISYPLDNKKIYVANKYLSYKDLVGKDIPFKERPYPNQKAKYILLKDNYCLMIIDSFQANLNINLNSKLILICPDYKYKTLLDVISNSKKQMYIYHIYKNIFIMNFGEKEEIYYFEFFPKKEKIEMICVLKDNKNDFNIYESYEFNSKYCILVTDKGILFYDWKKNLIIRTINIELGRDRYLQSKLVNKFYLVGICSDSIFVYNFLIDKLINFKNDELFSFFKNLHYNSILKIYNNLIITWNESSFYIMRVMPSRLKLIHTGYFNGNNAIEDNENQEDNENSEYNEVSEDNASQDSVNESNSDQKELFSGIDIKDVFKKSLFDIDMKPTNDIYNNENKTLFKTIDNKSNDSGNDELKKIFGKGLFD